MLEDGHWADTPTLLLLRHLARSAWSARLLILATFRDSEADMPVELVRDACRPAPRRRRRATAPGRALRGGGRDLVSRAAGSDPDPELRELATTIHDLTEGNAFLVCELWRALVETGIVEVADGQVRVTRPLTELGTPESVREVVSQRLSRLAPRTTTCSSSLPWPGRSSSWSRSAAPRALPSPSCSPRSRRRWAAA